MKRILMTTAAIAMGLPLQALADEIAVHDVSVEAGIEAVEDREALEKWPELVTDLEAAVTAAFVDMSAEDGYDLKVVLDGIGLDGAAAMGDAEMFSALEGSISVLTQEGEILGNVPVSVEASVLEVTSADGGLVVAPSTEQVYEAMVAGFATVARDEVASALLRSPSEDDDGA